MVETARAAARYDVRSFIWIVVVRSSGVVSLYCMFAPKINDYEFAKRKSSRTIVDTRHDLLLMKLLGMSPRSIVQRHRQV